MENIEKQWQMTRNYFFYYLPLKTLWQKWCFHIILLKLLYKSNIFVSLDLRVHILKQIKQQIMFYRINNIFKFAYVHLWQWKWLWHSSLLHFGWPVLDVRILLQGWLMIPCHNWLVFPHILKIGAIGIWIYLFSQIV